MAQHCRGPIADYQISAQLLPHRRGIECLDWDESTYAVTLDSGMPESLPLRLFGAVLPLLAQIPVLCAPRVNPLYLVAPTLVAGVAEELLGKPLGIPTVDWEVEVIDVESKEWRPANRRTCSSSGSPSSLTSQRRRSRLGVDECAAGRLVMMSPMQDQIWMLNVPNGVKVPARFIRPTDARAPQRFHHRLGQQSICRRFFELLSGLSKERARYFTELDGIERFAIVALDPGNRSEIVAAARIDGEPKTTTGEFAVIVEDRWQGVGVGLTLTEVLFEFASRRCFRRVFAHVLPENHQVVSLVHDLGLMSRSRSDGGAIRIDIDRTIGFNRLDGTDAEQPIGGRHRAQSDAT